VLIILSGSSLFLLASPLPKKGPLPKESSLEDNEAPKATKRQDGDDVKDSSERTESNQSLGKYPRKRGREKKEAPG
jgi:hypothetical protein